MHDHTECAGRKDGLMKKIIGVVGSGMIGRNPFDPTCWSRSGYNLFAKLQGQGALFRAFGVEVPHPLRGMLMLKNFHRNRTLWAQRFNLDPVYYRCPHARDPQESRDEDFEKDNVILQIGGHYNGFRASTGKISTYSYHDGNIAGMMKSPFFPKTNLPHAQRAYSYENSVFKDMSKIFVMAEYWRRSFIEDFGVEPPRVVNVGVGVNMEIPPVIPKDYSRKQVVYVGIDFVRKGGENLAKAFRLLLKRHSDATLHIVGPRTIPAALQQPGLRNVEYHGPLSREVSEQKAKLLEVLKRARSSCFLRFMSRSASRLSRPCYSACLSSPPGTGAFRISLPAQPACCSIVRQMRTRLPRRWTLILAIPRAPKKAATLEGRWSWAVTRGIASWRRCDGRCALEAFLRSAL